MTATCKASIEKQKISALEKVIIKKLKDSQKGIWMLEPTRG
jgi:hypothetical protein